MLISANKNFLDGVTRFMFAGSGLDVPIVSVSACSPMESFVFNPELLSLKAGSYVLVDYCEYGSKEWLRDETHVFGRNTEKFTYRFNNDDWLKFDQWVKDNPPLFIFKRELLEVDRSDFLLPIEYPCLVNDVPPAQTEEEFNTRPIELFHFWGWSHDSRRAFHGNAWIHASLKNIAVCDNLAYLNGIVGGIDANHGKVQRVWITTNIPDFARLPLPTIMQVNGFSKLSLSLPGCGVKCVRHGESPVNSIMVMQEDNLAWSYPWIHGTNSIKVEIGTEAQDLWGITGKSPEIAAIEDAITRPDLYEIYLAGLDNCRRYLLRNYIEDYIKPNILARL